MDKKITNDIIDIARDLEHEGRNGRNHHTTWAKGKGKKERWRVGNTIGYVSQTPSQLDWDIIWFYHAVQRLPLVTLLCSLFSQFLLPTSRLPHPLNRPEIDILYIEKLHEKMSDIVSHVCEMLHIHFRQFPTTKSHYRQKTCWVNSFHLYCHPQNLYFIQTMNFFVNLSVAWLVGLVCIGVIITLLL